MWAAVRNAPDYAVSLAAYALSSLFHKPMATLEQLDSVANLSPLVCRVLGQNPGPFTLQGTNTYLVGSGKRRILIDTGEPKIVKFREELQRAFRENGIEGLSAIICTHWHGDHVGGLPEVLADLAANGETEQIPVYKHRRTESNAQAEEEGKYEFLDDGQLLKTEGATLKVIYSPGHTSDHIGLWLEEEGTLFTGDAILGCGTTVFEDLHDYMQSLDKLRALKPAKLYPGHGPVVESADAKFAEYIEHRMLRERQVVDALREMRSGSSMDITNRVYQAVPLAVKIAAVANVRHHLHKLQKENRVRSTGLDYWELVTSNQ